MVGRGPRGLLGRAVGVVRDRGPLRQRVGQRRDARRGVVPRRVAELRRAAVSRGAARRAGDRARHGVIAARGDDLGRAGRPGGALRGRPAAARGRARRPGGGVHAERARDGRGIPRVRVDRRGVVELRAGVRHADRGGPLQADRAEGADRDGRLPLRRQGLRPARPRGRDRGRDPLHRAHGARCRAGGTSSWPSRPSSPSSACRSTTRCGCSTRPARPACRRRSSRGRAGSCSSI